MTVKQSKDELHEEYPTFDDPHLKSYWKDQGIVSTKDGWFFLDEEEVDLPSGGGDCGRF